MKNWKQTDFIINIGIASNQFIMDFYIKITLSTGKMDCSGNLIIGLIGLSHFIGYTYMVFHNSLRSQ